MIGTHVTIHPSIWYQATAMAGLCRALRFPD
jgi:hypothetical protein